MQTAGFLQQQPLFGGVDDQAMTAIMPLLREENFASGELIVREGDQGDSLFVICSGSVEVLKSSPEAQTPFGDRIAVLKVGDVIGEMELIDMQNRSATVRALEPVSTLALSNGDLFRIYESDLPTFCVAGPEPGQGIESPSTQHRRSGSALHAARQSRRPALIRRNKFHCHRPRDRAPSGMPHGNVDLLVRLQAANVSNLRDSGRTFHLPPMTA